MLTRIRGNWKASLAFRAGGAGGLTDQGPLGLQITADATPEPSRASPATFLPDRAIASVNGNIRIQLESLFGNPKVSRIKGHCEIRAAAYFIGSIYSGI